MDTFARRKTHPSQRRHIVYRASMVGPVFMLGCISVFYLYSMADMMQRQSTHRTLQRASNMDALYSKEANPWDSELLRVVMHTHVGTPALLRTCSVHLSVIIDAPALNPMSQVEGLMQFSPPHMDLHLFLHSPSMPGTVSMTSGVWEQQALLPHRMLFNASISEDTSVDITTLEIASGTKQQTRAFRMALHALYELQHMDKKGNESRYILLLHRSCVVDLSWDITKLLNGGRGFLLLQGNITSHKLYTEVAAHDLGITSGSILPTKRSSLHMSPPFHCSGSIMHALHSPHLPIDAVV
jgi:hypothetical protein